MGLDLSEYPATKDGAWEMVDALTPDIVQLWRVGRRSCQTDDLIVVVNARSNVVKVAARAKVYSQFKRQIPDLDLLEYVSKPPRTSNGSIRVWVVIGFRNGGLGCLPFTIAYS